ncbi:MAG: O-acetyl-ADP-ribose deacetylase [Dehalococcoidia bacterium]|nr:MAG: O-acetyl-ADP-ribose deacetylase [Dehalococcoidia bacterium]
MNSDITEITISQTKLSLVQGDITRQATDVIVNAANSSLMGGGGVDGAIHAAGGSAILEESRRLVAERGLLPPGQAVITTGGRLKAKYVIHTVGPVWYGGCRNEAATLASAYRESLKLAIEHGLSSVSFPSISTGAYRYPLDEAAKIAVETVVSFLKDTDTSLREVVFVLYDGRTYRAYLRALGETSERL